MAGQVWATDTLGGYMYSDELSNVLRLALQPMTRFRQLCDAKDATEKGLHAGDKFYWNVYSDAATRGQQLTEDETLPQTNFTVAQRSLTVNEYGNSVPYTGKLDNLSKHPVKEIIHKVLKNDANKIMDALAYNAFDDTKLRASVNSSTITFAVDGTADSVNDDGLDTTHVKSIVDYMKERNIPMFDGKDYYAVGWPSTFRDLKNSLEAIHQYVDSGFQMIMNGEIGRYEGVRFIEQTNIPKGGAADSTTFNALTGTADAWNGGKSDWVFFMGEDTVTEAIVIPEEIRGKIPTDYGRSRGVAWYYLGGFGIVHDVAADSRIVKWDSSQ